MPTLSSGRIEVFTFREGLLSPIAHDLRLRLERFEISHDEAAVEGRFWPDSLVVEGAVEHGRLNENVLSSAQRDEILDNLRHKILRTIVHPEARFRASVAAGAETHEPTLQPQSLRPSLGNSRAVELTGVLELVGSTRPITLVVHARDQRLQGELELRPSDWGIKPYRALLGTIRLADRVRVRFDLPDERR